MGAVTFGIPKDLVIQLRDIFSADVFIETGTFKGATTSWAAGYFKEVYTIENSAELYGTTSKELSKFPNVNCLLGNSAEKLSELLNQLNRPAILWLDAHWCGGLTYGAQDECPLMDEIAQINKTAEQHIILIDDARYFLKPPKQTHSNNQWPGLNEIIPALMVKQGYYAFACEDIIAAVPIAGKEKLIPYFNKNHENEFPGSGIIRNLKFALKNIARKWK